MDGTCKLTGNVGKLVKAHIIPRALALPRSGGEAFAQIGSRKPPSRRRDSWYDRTIVTGEGEDILTGYDTWAIEELRRLKLVWQSWGPMQALCTNDFEQIAGTPWGPRKVTLSDPGRLRLFFLSVLWRAAVSTRNEFDEVLVRPSDMRRLRRMLVDGIPAPLSFFPMTLTQLSTIGRMHNHGPIAQTKLVRVPRSTVVKRMPIFRFYFDGLVVHFHPTRDPDLLSWLGPMAVGAGPELIITTVTYEASWQRENLHNVLQDSEHEFPGGIARAEGPLR